MMKQEATNERDAVSLRRSSMMQQEATNERDAVSLRRSPMNCNRKQPTNLTLSL